MFRIGGKASIGKGGVLLTSSVCAANTAVRSTTRRLVQTNTRGIIKVAVTDKTLWW